MYPQFSIYSYKMLHFFFNFQLFYKNIIFLESCSNKKCLNIADKLCNVN